MKFSEYTSESYSTNGMEEMPFIPFSFAVRIGGKIILFKRTMDYTDNTFLTCGIHFSLSYFIFKYYNGLHLYNQRLVNLKNFKYNPTTPSSLLKENKNNFNRNVRLFIVI